MRVYIETYGCALNIHDTIVMEGLITSNGHVIVGNVEEADTVIVNTCAVRLDTERRMEKRLRELHTKYPDKKIVVAGCLAKARPYLVYKAVPRASMISPQNIHRITEVLETSDRKIFLNGNKQRRYLPAITNSKTIATIAVSEGCLSNCSFCITKIARRKVSSYPIKMVVKAAKKLVEKGVKEIRLTAQDMGVYGYDIYGKIMLPELIESILNEVDGEYYLRIGMMSPQHLMNVIDEMLSLYRDHRVYKFFHLPVQSGSDRVLRLMNREYSVEEYIDLISEIKRKIPNAYIATDIIVGHPGETWEDFSQTLELIKSLEFDKVHIARYTYRPRTLAGKLEQLPESEKKRRSSILANIVEDIGRKKNKRFLGKTLDAIVLDEGFKRQSLIARTENYMPIVIPGGYEGLLGKNVRIFVNDYTFFDLRGVPVENN
jgi:threonylcarbamoyladenosine tRNA methylthiotransferase CDKAL1